MNNAINVDAIRQHYDRLSPLYHRFWGEHIHHGLWRNGESPRVAQIRLIEQLAQAAAVPRGAHVLDVGCGLGGPALWLARELGCSVVGITLSPVQVKVATKRAHAEGLSERVRFEVSDANKLKERQERFDVVWTVECSEHLFDKARFCADCARILNPGGRFALCAWLGRPASHKAEELIRDVCRGMLCPSLGTREDYIQWMRAAGFERIQSADLTHSVARTWARVDTILRRREVRAIVRHGTAAMREFAQACGGIRQAYATGAMAYGLFAAELAGSTTTTKHHVITPESEMEGRPPSFAKASEGGHLMIWPAKPWRSRPRRPRPAQRRALQPCANPNDGASRNALP